MTAELCSLWTPFGAIAAQFNHIAVILALATLESDGFDMRYHDLLVRTLAGCARARFPYDYFSSLSEVREDARRIIATDTDRSSAPTPSTQTQRYANGKNA